MYSFRNDYSELAHENILNLMSKAAKEQNIGYGLDNHSDIAKELIKKHINNKNVDIHFLVGGTSCNKIVITHTLKPYEAVISVNSGHINVHETGAIEASGHKILTVKGVDGKITTAEIIKVCKSHTDEHMVKPKMVYISNSTETGSIYNKLELTEISNLCKELDLFLYLDGARLGVALTSDNNDLTINDIANLTDAFYIGGTKNGAMLGEALILINDKLKDSFRHSIKQGGGMLAKGYVTGLQFEGLFKNDLFFKLAKQANATSKILKSGLQNLNIEFAFDSPTNQQFIILDNDIVRQIEKEYSFEVWEKYENKTAIRLVTSWATEKHEVDKFLVYLDNIITKSR